MVKMTEAQMRAISPKNPLYKKGDDILHYTRGVFLPFAMTSDAVSGVYKIQNLTNGFFYIGSSKDLKRRINGHISMLELGSHIIKKMQNDFNSLDENIFKAFILEQCEEDELSRVENKWFKVYGVSFGNCNTYNTKTTSQRGELLCILKQHCKDNGFVLSDFLKGKVTSIS